jgi:hypothetical protein
MVKPHRESIIERERATEANASGQSECHTTLQ